MQSFIGCCYKSVDGLGRYSRSQRVNIDHTTFIKSQKLQEKQHEVFGQRDCFLFII